MISTFLKVDPSSSTPCAMKIVFGCWKLLSRQNGKKINFLFLVVKNFKGNQTQVDHLETYIFQKNSYIYIILFLFFLHFISLISSLKFSEPTYLNSKTYPYS